MSKKPMRYEISEKDIDTVITILKSIDPEYATPENAITLLERLQVEIHELSHTNPEKLEVMYKELIKDKKRIN